jgi:hypothetical protein
MHRSHQYHIRHQDDDTFPQHLPEDIEARQLQTILDTSNRENIGLAATLDILLHIVASGTSFDYQLLQMQPGIEAHVLNPKVNSRDALPMPFGQPWLGCYAATGVLCSTRQLISPPEMSSSSIC